MALGLIGEGLWVSTLDSRLFLVGIIGMATAIIVGAVRLTRFSHGSPPPQEIDREKSGLGPGTCAGRKLRPPGMDDIRIATSETKEKVI